MYVYMYDDEAVSTRNDHTHRATTATRNESSLVSPGIYFPDSVSEQIGTRNDAVRVRVPSPWGGWTDRQRAFLISFLAVLSLLSVRLHYAHRSILGQTSTCVHISGKDVPQVRHGPRGRASTGSTTHTEPPQPLATSHPSVHLASTSLTVYLNKQEHVQKVMNMPRG